MRLINSSLVFNPIVPRPSAEIFIVFPQFLLVKYVIKHLQVGYTNSSIQIPNYYC